MEIGSRYGGTLYCWSQIATSDAFILSLDWHRKDQEEEMKRLLSTRVLPTQDFHCVWGDSHSISVKEAVGSALQDRSVDLLFIDGDHSYDGVKEDFLTYSKYVRSGGCILFHDIVPNHHFPEYGVDKFWRELSNRFGKSLEFVDSVHPGRGAGIGLIVKP
jgi:cephalosporin hydroxylase